MSNHDLDYDDDDDFVEDEPVQAKPAPKGLAGLGLNSLAHSNNQKRQEELSAQGEDCIIVFQLPSGEAKKHTVKMNLAIESLKVLIEKNYGIPFDDHDLYIDNKLAPNPFSLSDIPSIQAGKENVVVVKQK